jgi:hypothetical protein
MFFARFPGEFPYFSRVQITQSLTLNRLSMTDSDPSSKTTYIPRINPNFGRLIPSDDRSWTKFSDAIDLSPVQSWG